MYQDTLTTTGSVDRSRDQYYREALAVNIPNVTPTELSIGVLLLLRHDTKQIAAKLKMDIRSIDNHRYRIRKKLGLKRIDNLEMHLLRIVHRGNL